jgi:hypothetical protein
VGAAQAWVLRRVLAISKRAWIGATVLGAITAWLLGMVPRLFLEEAGGELASFAARALLMITAAGAAVGAVHGLVLVALLRSQTSAAPPMHDLEA